MVWRVFTLFILTGCLCNFSFANNETPNEFTLLLQERIGDLRIDLPETVVKKAIRCPLKREADTLWGADGMYHQTWIFVDCGIMLDMASDKKGGKKSIVSITLIPPSTLRTTRNIRIGSTRQEVMQAYKRDWNKEDSDPTGSFVAGSIYGGLVFGFEKDRVNRIFLGAAAE